MGELAVYMVWVTERLLCFMNAVHSIAEVIADALFDCCVHLDGLNVLAVDGGVLMFDLLAFGVDRRDESVEFCIDVEGLFAEVGLLVCLHFKRV